MIQQSAELRVDVDAASKALSAAADVFARDGRLVAVVQVDGDRDGGVAWTPGTPQIRTITSATLREKLTDVALFQSYDRRSKKSVAALPSAPLVEATRDRGEWPGVRQLVGIIETPTIRRDGSIIDTPGYDASTGYLYRPSAQYLPVPPRTTHADAVVALAELGEVFADFPCAPAHRAVLIAAVLTLLARPAIAGAVPIFVVDAPSPGSGKTLALDAASMIPTGRSAARMTWTSRDEELEKVLGAYAMRGAAVVGFDNVTGAFGGGPLDKCVTAVDRVELRVLGRSEIQAMPWRAVVLASGNNVQVVGDTIRRVLLARLDPECEKPQDRTDFAHPDLLAWVRAERPRLVRAALIVLAAYFRAGRPPQGTKRWGSFEAWSDLIPPAIVFAGGPDVLEARLDGGESIDPVAGALVGILDALERIDPKRTGVTAKELVTLLYPLERLRGQAPPDGFDDARAAVETLVSTPSGKAPDAVRVGNALRRLKGRIVGGRRLVMLAGRGGVARWTADRLGWAGGAGCAVSNATSRDRTDNSRDKGRNSPTNPTCPTNDADEGAS